MGKSDLRFGRELSLKGEQGLSLLIVDDLNVLPAQSVIFAAETGDPGTERFGKRFLGGKPDRQFRYSVSFAASVPGWSSGQAVSNLSCGKDSVYEFLAISLNR